MFASTTRFLLLSLFHFAWQRRRRRCLTSLLAFALPPPPLMFTFPSLLPAVIWLPLSYSYCLQLCACLDVPSKVFERNCSQSAFLKSELHLRLFLFLSFSSLMIYCPQSHTHSVRQTVVPIASHFAAVIIIYLFTRCVLARLLLLPSRQTDSQRKKEKRKESASASSDVGTYSSRIQNIFPFSLLSVYCRVCYWTSLAGSRCVILLLVVHYWLEELMTAGSDASGMLQQQHSPQFWKLHQLFSPLAVQNAVQLSASPSPVQLMCTARRVPVSYFRQESSSYEHISWWCSCRSWS